MNCSHSALRRRTAIFAALAALALHTAPAQNTENDPQGAVEVPDVPRTVEVEPIAEDAEISARLTRILEATGWFTEPEISVDEGVVFLSGFTGTEKHKTWAGQLAGNTRDVVAVVNRIEVFEQPLWDLSSTWGELRALLRDAVRHLPLILVGLIILALTWFAAVWSKRGVGALLHNRVKSRLLRTVTARLVAIPVFLLGLYAVLKVSGLTGLAATVLGGTGLLGLVVGFAFRDIAENFLSSVLISMQRPFAMGDMIEVGGQKGFVQSVNARSTLLMTLDGNHVQIPNATIYKSTIINYTANPNARFEFIVGIGYEDSVSEAQSVALAVLRNHPAVVDDPEPLILADELGAATVNLRILFWVNIANHSGPKVRSAVIRLTKSAFTEAGISMPDEAREVVFPAGVPVTMLSENGASPAPSAMPAEKTPPREELSAHSAEGDLASEAGDIEAQAQQSRSPEEGDNLLEDA